MAQFKEIMALRLDNRSYSYIAATLGCSNRDITKVQAIITTYNGPSGSGVRSRDERASMRIGTHHKI